MSSRFDASYGRIEYNGETIAKLANKPLVPNELFEDDQLDFVEGLEPIGDLPDVPDDLRKKLIKHGYWPEQS